MAAIKDVLPDRLRRKVPPVFFMCVEQRGFWTLFGLALCFIGLYTDVPRAGARNGYLCFLGPVVVPAMVALRYKLFPLNPYRTVAGRIMPAGIESEEDPDRKRLVDLLRSIEARRFTLLQSMQLSAILVLTSTLVPLFWRAPLVWTHTFDPLVIGSIVCFIGALIFVNTKLVCWALKKWERLLA